MRWIVPMVPILRRAALPMTALALIGVGSAWFWSWPAGLISVGLLMWIDLMIEGARA